MRAQAMALSLWTRHLAELRSKGRRPSRLSHWQLWMGLAWINGEGAGHLPQRPKDSVGGTQHLSHTEVYLPSCRAVKRGSGSCPRAG